MGSIHSEASAAARAMDVQRASQSRRRRQSRLPRSFFRPRSLLTAALLLAMTSVLAAPVAHAACCYFAAQDKDINQPGQKAFISWNPAEKLEAFTVQPKFEGNALDFGMVVPSPAQPKLDEMPRDFFKDLAIYTILMPLPEPVYIELEPQPVMRMMAMASKVPSSAMRGGALAVPKSSVRVLESGVVGSLDYKIIVADRADDLFTWLKENRYSYGGDQDTLQFYIKKKWFFTVMKIDSKQMKKASDGSYLGEITPTRFTFRSDKVVYPLKITQLSVKDKTDALFYVQAPRQMDLTGDRTWQPSYRVMYLTYMLGCAANAEQEKELEARNAWLEKRHQTNPAFETTKLEWARKLGHGEMSVLADPLKHYANGGLGDLPPGSKAISLAQFIAEVKADYERKHKRWTDYAKNQLAELQTQYAPGQGKMVKNALTDSSMYLSTRYTWYPNREAPAADVKGLSRLRGHLQEGMWLTKFRRVLDKAEMTDDLVLEPVAAKDEQTYTRIMPTSPP